MQKTSENPGKHGSNLNSFADNCNRLQLTSNVCFRIAVIVCNYMETGLIKIMEKFNTKHSFKTAISCTRTFMVPSFLLIYVKV